MSRHFLLAGFGVAAIVHSFVLVLVIFTFEGTVRTYKLNIVFLGDILRPQEVLPLRQQASGLKTEPNSNMVFEQWFIPGAWMRSIQPEKSDSFYCSLPPKEDDIFHFIGQRVFPEERDKSFNVVGELPGAGIDLHLRVP
ncbi:MAG: hypothetical protein WCI27_05950 [Candidatus Omnitrophota bacterium]